MNEVKKNTRRRYVSGQPSRLDSAGIAWESRVHLISWTRRHYAQPDQRRSQAPAHSQQRIQGAGRRVLPPSWGVHCCDRHGQWGERQSGYASSEPVVARHETTGALGRSDQPVLQGALIQSPNLPQSRPATAARLTYLATTPLEMPSGAAMRSCESWASSFRRRTSLILRIVILRISGMPAPAKAGRLPAWGEQICATHHAADSCRCGIVTDIPVNARNRSRQTRIPSVAVLRQRTGWPARRCAHEPGDVGQAQRARSMGLSQRCADAPADAHEQPHRRVAAASLAATDRRSSARWAGSELAVKVACLAAYTAGTAKPHPKK